jgi:hypothetical protein
MGERSSDETRKVRLFRSQPRDRLLGYYRFARFRVVPGRYMGHPASAPGARGDRPPGLPSLFLEILGTWKLLGAIALAAPRFPRLKEWAYAGVVFDLTGALASHVVSGFIEAGVLLYLIVLTGVTFASWVLRPPARRLEARVGSGC